MASLEWLNTPVSLRLRTIIFTPNAPVGKRWKVLVVSVSGYSMRAVALTTPIVAHRICACVLRVHVDRMDHPTWCCAGTSTAPCMGREAHELIAALPLGFAPCTFVLAHALPVSHLVTLGIPAVITSISVVSTSTYISTSSHTSRAPISSISLPALYHLRS